MPRAKIILLIALALLSAIGLAEWALPRRASEKSRLTTRESLPRNTPSEAKPPAAPFSDPNGTTPLMLAAAAGNQQLLGELAKDPANRIAVDRNGGRALDYAIAANQPAGVSALAEQTSLEALGYALDAGADPQIVCTLLEKLPAAEKWEPVAMRALRRALLLHERAQVRLLLARHSAPPLATPTGLPLIAQAVIDNDADVFSLLLEGGTNPNSVLPSPATPAMVEAVPARYLRHYVDEDSGVNLLMLAGGLGREDFVRALLAAGASRNHATPKFNMLPIYFAARSDSWRCVQMLLGTGPAPDQLRIEIALGAQRLSVMNGGTAVYTTSCSTGRDGFGTPAGNYVVTDKDRDHRSTIYKVPMPYFMRLNCRDFGLHEGVVAHQRASHGCIRLPGEAAQKLFTEIPIGTVVLITNGGEPSRAPAPKRKAPHNVRVATRTPQ